MLAKDYSSHCDYQVLRMSQLAYFPKEPAALGELCRALEEACGGDKKLAERVVDEVMETSVETPKPAMIRMLAWRVQHPDGQAPAGDPLCPDCHGAGFVVRRPDRAKFEQRYPGVDYEGYADKFAVPCRCRQKTQGAA